MDEPPAAFREGIASLSRERFVAFVADLWEERGRAVAREGERLRVREPTGETTVVRPLAGGESPPESPDADVVVAADSAAAVPAGVEVVGPADLYRLVRYGLDRPAGDRLLATYADPALARAGGGAGSSASDREPPARGTVGAPAAGDGAGSPGRREDDQAAPGDGQPSPAGNGWGRTWSRRRALAVAGSAFAAGLGIALATRPERDDRPDTSADAGTDRPAVLAPGVTERGVVDPEALALAHADRLQNTSYTVGATKTIHDDGGRLRSSWSTRVEVGRSRAFRARVATEGPDAPLLLGDPPVSAVVWSDRETYLRRVTTASDTYYAEVLPRVEVNDWYYWSNVVPVGGLPFSTHEFYRELFEAVPTRVEPAAGSDAPASRVVAAGVRLDEPPLFMAAVDSDDPVAGLDLLARVHRTGLVSSLRLGYRGRLGDRPVSVQWSIAYDDVGETSVERPDWYGRAREDAAGGNRSTAGPPTRT